MNIGGFPNMMGGGPMGMPQQPGQAQVQAELMRNYTQQQAQMNMGDWRHSVQPQERAGHVMELSTSLMLAKPGLSSRESYANSVGIERNTLAQSADKNSYVGNIRRTLQQLTEARSRNAAQSMNAMQMRTMQQSGMMPQGSMQPNQQNQQNQNQPFPPQLQQQMQASPLNPQNLMQMSNSNMGNTQMAPQGNQPPQQGTSAAQQTQQPQRFNNADFAQISHIANTLMQNAPQERIEQIQARFAKLNPAQQESVRQKVGNPVALHFRQEAQKIWLAERNRQLQAKMGNQRQNGMGVNPAMAQNQLLQRNAQQTGNAQGMPGGMGAQSFDVSQFAGQQQDAMRSADAGQLVVPASNNLTLNPQVGGMPMGMNQSGALGQQAMGAGQMQNAAQRPQNFINPQQAQQAQQAQQLRLRMAAQAQAQAKAQQDLQRQQTQQMTMGNQMSGMTSQTNPMSLLTQPVTQPAQTGAGTPQQRPQSTMPQLPQQPNQLDPKALQALQQHQNRVNNLGAVRRQLPAFAQNFPEQIRLSLSQMPDDAYQVALQRLRTRSQQPTGQGAFSSAQMQNLQRPQVPTPQPGGSNPLMGAGNQQPGQIPNQAQMAGNTMNEQMALQRLQQQMMAGSNLPPQLLQQLDQKPFPPSLGPANNFTAPENVKTWGQLKQWVLQNQSSPTPPNLTIHKVLQLQLRLLQQSNPAQGRMNQAPNGSMMPQTGPASVPASMPGQGMPNFQPQQQIPPNTLAQNWQAIPVTPEEMMILRQRHPQFQNASDEVLRQFIQKNKLRQRMQQSQLAQTQALQQQMSMAQAAQPQRPMPQMPQQRPPSQQAQQQPGMPTMPTPQMPTPRQPSASQLPQGVKRPAAEDLVEVAQPTAPSAPMQANISQQRPSNGPAQHLQPGQQNGVTTNSTLPPKSNIPHEVLERKWQELLRQYENSPNVPKRPPGPILPQVRRHLQNLIKETAPFIPELDDCIRTFFMNSGNDNGTTSYLRMRLVLRENINFQNFTLVQNLTIDPKLLEKMLDQVRKFVASVSISYKKQNLRGRQGAAQAGPATIHAQQQQPSNQSDAATTNQQMSTMPAQLNAVNLQQHNQQQATHRRPNIKPPAAPTVGPGQLVPFATSPQGVPKYEGPQKVWAADLKIPPKKKQRTGQTATPSSTAQATPGSAASPQVGKTGSPELLRKQAEAKVEAQKPAMAFKCLENGCGRAFHTQEELDSHKKDTHVVPEDCLSYALENLAESIGLNKDGTVKAPSAEAHKASAKAFAKPTSDPHKKGSEQPPKAGTSAPADSKAGATDKTADKVDAAEPMDVDDPWANSPLKPSEIAEIFNPVAQLISPTSVIDAFNPTRAQLIKAGIISADRPLTPLPSEEEVPDLSDPNTTPSPTLKNWREDPWYTEYTMPKWALQPVETWLPARPPSDVDDTETIFDDDEMRDLLPGSPVDLERPWIKRTGEEEEQGKTRERDVVSIPGHVWAKNGWVGPREDEEMVVPVTEKQKMVREEERRKREKERERDEENRRKDPERLKKWREEKAGEKERLRREAEEIERLQFLRQKDVPGWENFDPFEEFVNA